MKNLFSFCFCSFMICQLMAQPFEKKQITNFSYDSRGASFPTYPLGLSFAQKSPIFFEAHESNISNIIMMSYDSVADSFFNPIPITSSNYLNINPIADASYLSNGELNLIWQTNENGNWELVLKTLKESIWSDKEVLVNSLEEEINAQFVIGEDWSSTSNSELEFVYEKGNSVYLYQRKDSIINNEVVFMGNDSTSYAYPTCIKLNSNLWAQTGGLLIGAVCKKNDSSSTIVFIQKPSTDSSWSSIYTLYQTGNLDNPRFCDLYTTYPLFSFEKSAISKREINLIFNFSFPDQNLNTASIIGDSNLVTTDFNGFVYGIVGRALKNNSDDFYGPHSYKVISNDSVYVIRPNWGFYESYYTKVSDTKIGIGNLGYERWGAISYIIWEDSTNGHINLFGVKRLDPIGDINDEITVNNFILYQNYPNPFNPKTVIKYKLLTRDFVTLKVYNVLGKEVSTLINEEQLAGEYQSAFNALNLASGIYIYRLTVGKNHLSKKMVLLK